MKATIHQQFHPSCIVDKKFHPIPHEQGGTKKYEYVAKKINCLFLHPAHDRG